MARILCIDDNLVGLKARKALLEKIGHAVLTARTGDDGLDTLRREKPDLVILDYKLPRWNGGDLAREIKRTQAGVPVILLSAYAETMSLGEKVPEADYVLCKDHREVPELLSAVTRLLRKRMKKPGASVRKKDTAPKRRPRRA